MPEISFFYGIKIYINYLDHNPPHFHAKYGEYDCLIYLEDWLIEGIFPKRALNMVLEWAEIHKGEILEDWNLARNKKELNKIAPLK